MTALADPTRRAVYEILGRGPRSVGELSNHVPVTRPAVSQHLKVLTDAGLVRAEVAGTRRVYAVEPRGLAPLRDWIDGQWEAVLDAFEAAARKEDG